MFVVARSLLYPPSATAGFFMPSWAVTGEHRRALVADDPSTPQVRDEEMEGRRLAEHLVLLSYLSDAAGRRARRTSLWRRGETGWRLLHHQGTLVG